MLSECQLLGRRVDAVRLDGRRSLCSASLAREVEFEVAVEEDVDVDDEVEVVAVVEAVSLRESGWRG